jgi:diacylglycerol kinase family enzyme
MARLAVSGGSRWIDMARVDERAFLNVAGFGFDAAVLAYMETVTWLQGEALYLYAALRQLFGYRGTEVRVRAGAADSGVRTHLMVVVANGRRFGSSFLIAPRAELDDGQLDVVAIGNVAGAGRRLALFAAAMKGQHTAEPEVSEWRAARVELSFREPPVFEADGELHRAARREVVVECVPRAVRLVTPSAGGTGRV